MSHSAARRSRNSTVSPYVTRRFPKQTNREVIRGIRETLSQEQGKFTPKAAQTKRNAHVVGDKAEQAYRRSGALEKRRQLMGEMAKLCEPRATPTKWFTSAHYPRGQLGKRSARLVAIVVARFCMASIPFVRTSPSPEYRPFPLAFANAL